MRSHLTPTPFTIDPNSKDLLIRPDDSILVTGAAGFIGSVVVKLLAGSGFNNVRCFLRPSSTPSTLTSLLPPSCIDNVHFVTGNLLEPLDCLAATKDVTVIVHLAAGRQKSFATCYMNSVLTTRNLIDAASKNANLKRFVNVSSMAVYSGRDGKKNSLLDETSEVDTVSHTRHEPYTYAKVKQEELLVQSCHRFNIPYVILRPGIVYGPGKTELSGKIGIDTFGIFLHLGGNAILPLTYVDNCAYAVALAAVRKFSDRQIFNIVDDDLPTSRDFLKQYKENFLQFHSFDVPYPAFYLFSLLWEKYSEWSSGQIPPAFNRDRCVAQWKPRTYTNHKLRQHLSWQPIVDYSRALEIHFAYLRETVRPNA